MVNSVWVFDHTQQTYIFSIDFVLLNKIYLELTRLFNYVLRAENEDK